jgi:hypothetical protein
LAQVPTDRLLLGGENRIPAAEYAAISGDLLRPSTRVADGPHVALLRDFRDHGAIVLEDEHLRATPYVANAMNVIALTGNYFSAHDEAAVLALARNFVTPERDPTAPARVGARMPGEPVRVRRIRHSDCFQVVDGHHRVARAVVDGAPFVLAAVEATRVSTPVQELVAGMSWTEGRRERYQPVVAPELGSAWPLVRACDDRLDLMIRFLSSLGVGSGATYLDVAACYGWFVARMVALGFDGHGVECDPNGVVMAEQALGVEPGRVVVGEASAYLGACDVVDVVSCFSLLHHFVLGRGPCSAEDLVGRLDRVTGRVLFLDTGQSHEAWFAQVLPEWDVSYIEKWLRTHSTFRDVIALGVDGDDRPPYTGNYGRTVFACVR